MSQVQEGVDVSGFIYALNDYRELKIMVRIVTYNGYYHMYKVIDGEHWVGMIDHRIGNLTNKITEEQANKLVDVENGGCYTEFNIASFGRATIEQLKQFENI